MVWEFNSHLRSSSSPLRPDESSSWIGQKSRSKYAIHFLGIKVNFAENYLFEISRSTNSLHHRGHWFANCTPVSIEVDDDVHVA
jgi:hypothetical protein